MLSGTDARREVRRKVRLGGAMILSPIDATIVRIVPSRTRVTAGPVWGTPVAGVTSSSWRARTTSGSLDPIIDARASTRVSAVRYSARVSGADPTGAGARLRTYGLPSTVAAWTESKMSVRRAPVSTGL